LLQRGKDLIAVLGYDHCVLKSRRTFPGEDDLGLHSESHPLLQRVGLALGQKGKFVELQANAVGNEMGLESWWPQVTLFVAQSLCQPKGLEENGLAVCPRPDLIENCIMNLPTGLVSIAKFLSHLPNGKHAGLVHLIAMVTCSKVDQNRLMGSHDPEACSNGKGWGKPQPSHRRI